MDRNTKSIRVRIRMQTHKQFLFELEFFKKYQGCDSNSNRKSIKSKTNFGFEFESELIFFKKFEFESKMLFDSSRNFISIHRIEYNFLQKVEILSWS